MKKSITGQVLAVVLSMTAVAAAGIQAHAAGAENHGSHEAIAEKYPEDEQGPLKFTPRVLFLGDMLRVAVPEEHPRGLAIKDPAGNFYVLQDADSPRPQLMAPGDFAKTRLFELDTLRIEGTVWADGKAMQERPFTKEGEYLIYMADDMETEPENTFSLMGTVYFLDHRPTTK